MKSAFDRAARHWDSDPVKVERAQAVAQAIRVQVPFQENMRALEYGCGTGLLSFALQPFPGRMTLSDSSPGMLQQLRRKIRTSRLDNMHPLQLDLSTDPLPAERYDLVYLLMTLHHIPDTRRILQAFFELLEPGGRLCIADLDREDGSFHGPGFDGHPGFERGELQALLAQAGFERAAFQTVFELGRAGRVYSLFLAVARKP
jgi:ubiquinone/menaquinone biosynthesis C-methylase UbiE